LDGLPSITAECLFVDPVIDIAVLGEPDGQFDDWAAYNKLVESVPGLVIAEAPRDGKAWLLSLSQEHGTVATSVRLTVLSGSKTPKVRELALECPGRQLFMKMARRSELFVLAQGQIMRRRADPTLIFCCICQAGLYVERFQHSDHSWGSL
jgi:hypothetical protein